MSGGTSNPFNEQSALPGMVRGLIVNCTHGSCPVWVIPQRSHSAEKLNYFLALFYYIFVLVNYLMSIALGMNRPVEQRKQQKSEHKAAQMRLPGDLRFHVDACMQPQRRQRADAEPDSDPHKDSLV